MILPVDHVKIANDSWAATLLFLNGNYNMAFVFRMAVTQGWKALSEVLRALPHVNPGSLFAAVRLDGHSELSSHLSHAGLRAWHTRRP